MGQVDFVARNIHVHHYDISLMIEKPFSTSSGKYPCMNPDLLLDKQC
jgi:hypothetical protein